MRIHTFRPNTSLTQATVVAAEDETGFAGDWLLNAHAICANPVAGLEMPPLGPGPTSRCPIKVKVCFVRRAK